jgi:hypothetical protein
LRYIKNCRNENVIIDIEYEPKELQALFYADVKIYHIGLVIVSKEMFSSYKIRKLLYDAHVPVLKISDRPLASVKDVALILADNRDLEKVSTTIFDISAQMGFNIELYNYENEHQEIIEQVIEHYNNLSAIFSKSIKVIKDNDNPIRVLKKKDNFVQILPFTSKLTARRMYSVFSTDSEKLYHKLDDYHQIFIPVQL